MGMKSKSKEVICPKCSAAMRYTWTSMKRHTSKEGRLKCKQCPYLFSKEKTEEIDLDVGGKRMVNYGI
ncbi:unnamed protein product [marine sediment metagenome]|uniref:Uncharacterized protein n=1 Tax=marine sediment metagenome TaxID=412755 RepID=X0W6E9_9ZZZZ